MKWLLLGLLALVASVTVALVALPDPGYVLLGYGKYSVETSLLVLVVVLALAYVALRLLAGVWHTPARLQHWDRQRHLRQLQKQFDRAVIEMAEGRLDSAERRLARVLKSPAAPLQAYLLAAHAASRTGADLRCDSYLNLAGERMPDAQTAIALTRAELLLHSARLEQAQTVLTQLRARMPRNSKVLRLAMQLYLQQQDWQKLRELLPELRRGKVLDEPQWQQLAVQVYHEQVLALSSASDAEALQAGWKQLPPPVQQDQDLLALYIEQLLRLGAHEQAAQLLIARLREDWNQRLVYLFGELQGADSAAQQAQAEHWLEQHGQDPVLLLSLARISLHNKLWGKARSYLEASIDIQPSAEAWRLLGNLLEQLEEPDKAADCYRRGLELVGQGPQDAALPAPLAGAEWQAAVPSVSRSA